MTVVFVHGVPETAAVWDPLLAALGRGDTLALSPPGFGAPVPAGFEATSDGYRDWLVAEVERIAAERGGPVTLVGHDWGGGHALRTATARPDLVRTLVTDIAGTGDPAYRWHDLAQVWQTPGAGEEIVAAMSALSIEARTDALVDAGMTPAGAAACAAANGDEMGACILTLYRSAVQPNMTRYADEYAALPHRPRTVVIAAHDDQFTGGPELCATVATRWGAEVVDLPGLGHWWMLHAPATTAEVLREFLGPE